MAGSLKQHFSRFLSAAPGRLHFAAHSHHPWPDVTFEAQMEAWLDAARHADEKWSIVFGRVMPEAQSHIAKELSLPDFQSIAFAPNTHELLVRLLSCLPGAPRIVTTDSEFHSAERQLRRLEEDGLADVVRVATEPFDTFPDRFAEAVRARRTHLALFSQVFYNSGFVVDRLEDLVAVLPRNTAVVIDGYHGFCAVPTDLSRLGSRVFYLAGGYKYAMAGEGACFLHVPPGLELRPLNTGWFASFGALDVKAKGKVPYSDGGLAFLGATFDPTGLYRFNAAMRWRDVVGLTTPVTRAWAHLLQHRFVEGLAALPARPVSARKLVVPLTNPHRGQFLTFRTRSARSLSAALADRMVLTDARDDRLRVGFGVAQDLGDVDALVEVFGALEG